MRRTIVYIRNLDFGIGELNMALLCTDWKSKVMIEDKCKADKTQDKNKDDDNNKEIPYDKFDDEDFDKVLEKMMDIRNLNMNKNMNDEERRKNAENAILMLSKYLNLEEGELDESD
jgi:hypothetical protein